jgi:putative transposase
MSTIQRAYKTKLALNNEQITACKRHAGATRWAYNWGLARKQEAYRATGKNPSAMDLHRDLNALKQNEVSWLYSVSKCAPQEALRNLDSAFAHFFRRCGVSAAQDPQARTGELPPHRQHCRVCRRHPVAAAGTASPQRAMLSSHRGQDPLRHGL